MAHDKKHSIMGGETEVIRRATPEQLETTRVAYRPSKRQRKVVLPNQPYEPYVPKKGTPR